MRLLRSLLFEVQTNGRDHVCDSCRHVVRGGVVGLLHPCTARDKGRSARRAALRVKSRWRGRLLGVRRPGAALARGGLALLCPRRPEAALARGQPGAALVRGLTPLPCAGLMFMSVNTTLKAFANSSPGLRFWQPWVHEVHCLEDATLKELRRRSRTQPAATPSELQESLQARLNPGFQSKPWAEISQRFQRIKRIESTRNASRGRPTRLRRWY